MTVTAISTPIMIEWLATRDRNAFAQSLVRYYRRNGHLTPRQDAAAQRMYADAHFTVPARPAARPAVDYEIVGEACANGCHDHCDHGNEDEARMVNAEMAAPAPERLTTGVYLLDGNLFRIRKSQYGRLYSLRLVGDRWIYEPAAIRSLTFDMRVPPEVASEYGLRTGICIFCEAVLDDKDGLGKRVGVGPVCCRNNLGMTQRQLAERLGL